MSPSNKLAVVICNKNTVSSILLDKSKGPAAVAAAQADSDAKSSAAFALMTKVECEKLKEELFKCLLESYINSLKGCIFWACWLDVSTCI